MKDAIKTLYADRKRGILLVPESEREHLAHIADETEFPTILICPDSIDNPERAIGFIAAHRNATAKQS